MAKIAAHCNKLTLSSPIEMTSTTQAWIEKMVGLGIGNLTATTCTKEDRQNGQQRQTSKKKIEKTFHDQPLVARLYENISNGNHIGNILKENLTVARLDENTPIGDILKENLAGYGPKSEALDEEKYKETHTHDVQARPMAKHTFRVERVNGIKWNMPPLRRSAIARAFTSAVHFRMHTPTTLRPWQVPSGFVMAGTFPAIYRPIPKIIS